MLVVSATCEPKFAQTFRGMIEHNQMKVDKPFLALLNPSDLYSSDSYHRFKVNSVHAPEEFVFLFKYISLN